jgi:substrate import-associated zinc metallohydrolase lipoprotein
MKLILKIAAVVLMISVIACSKKDNLDTTNFLGLGGDTTRKGTIDTWLYDSMTKPYNIEVKYRWDPWEVDISKTLTPPDESKVIPAMSIVKQIWIDPYTAETGSDAFIKKYAPKWMVLVGSPNYDFNNTEILANAEGGNKIVMFVINRFDKNNITELRMMLHTIEHEFAHILHQNILYPQEFKNITPGYTSTWFNFRDADAQEQGFVSAYAMASPDEDFVEMVSIMLVEGKARFNEMVTSQPTDAQTALRRKEQIVVDYFKKAWNIDFYSLQTRIQQALVKITAIQPAPFYIGFDKVYTTGLFSTDPSLGSGFLPASTAFTTLYNNASASLQSAYGVFLDYLEVKFETGNILSVKIHVADATGSDVAVYSFSYTKDANNIYDFTYIRADQIGTLIKSNVQPILDYFSNNTFKVDWYLDPNVTIYPRVTFIPQQTANATFTALLY